MQSAKLRSSRRLQEKRQIAENGGAGQKTDARYRKSDVGGIRLRAERLRRDEVGGGENSRGLQKFQAGEVAAQIAATDGCKPVALCLGMRSNERVRHEMRARTALLPIFPVDAASEMSGFSGNVVVTDGE